MALNRGPLIGEIFDQGILPMKATSCVSLIAS